jgi:hypothetical protein
MELVERTDPASVPLGNAAWATAAVWAGISGNARGRIDIATSLHWGPIPAEPHPRSPILPERPDEAETTPEQPTI